MAKNYFFHTLNFENYRGIRKLSIPNLKRVNIFGGLNGVGKSTVLDGIFLILDRGSPTALSRPFMTRNAKLPYPNGYNYIFHDQDISKVIKISGSAKTGSFEATIASSTANEMLINSPNSSSSHTNDVSSFSDSDSRGVTLKMKTNGRQLYDEIAYFQPNSENLGYNAKASGIAKTPPAAYTINAMMNAGEDSQRFSTLKKERRTESLYKELRLLYGDLKELHLLQEGGLPVLYAEFTDSSMVQSVLLGGGFQMMLSISLLMMTMKDGIFLFDEIDNTIHHSLLRDFWALVCRLANENNGQVFVVTHSRECIGSAVEGFQSQSKLADLGYYRLEEGLDQTNCIAYESNDLIDALSSDWEMR